ncbi:MAG TPA: 1-acyl-sn-glycerol-3-phosphate acyltransferase [Syntrophales bacterium]|nr:1-acyl-sn-glycerol-3-phosphate acyltransferase [Syntrophales bacterium]
MSSRHRGIFYNFVIFAFFLASRIMRQRPHLKGKENLREIPTPTLITVTHDSYYEIPSLSRVYYALHPKPDFLIMAKNDFLGGRYLSTNFAQGNRFLRTILLLLDRTGLPLAVFRTMQLTSIERPFIEHLDMKRQALHQAIDEQVGKFREAAARGLSTLIFPEGTTWGFGGLKKIRSAAFQVVEGAFESAREKVYILPINVKVDRLVRGSKDVFIRVGRPFFARKPKEEFNLLLFDTLQHLHTITFSQIAAYYLKRLAEIQDGAAETVTVEKERFLAALEEIVRDIHERVRAHVLPHLDPDLLDHRRLLEKVRRFLKYCSQNRYLLEIRRQGGKEILVLNRRRVLEDYPVRDYRKRNPVGFHANELKSLGEDVVRAIYDRCLSGTGQPPPAVPHPVRIR